MFRFAKTLFLPAVMLALCFGGAWAEDAPAGNTPPDPAYLAKQIDGWSGGGTGSLSASATGEREVTVTGNVENATRGFIIRNDENSHPTIVIKWDANITGYANGSHDIFINGYDTAVSSQGRSEEMTGPPASGGDIDGGGSNNVLVYDSFIVLLGFGEFVINGNISSSDDKTIEAYKYDDNNARGFDIIVGPSGIVSNNNSRYDDHSLAVAIHLDDSARGSAAKVEKGGQISAPHGIAISMPESETFTGDTTGITGCVGEVSYYATETTGGPYYDEDGNPLASSGLRKYLLTVYGAVRFMEELDTSEMPYDSILIVVENHSSLTLTEDMLLSKSTDVEMKPDSKFITENGASVLVKGDIHNHGRVEIKDAAITLDPDPGVLYNSGTVVVSSNGKIINKNLIENYQSGIIENEGTIDNNEGTIKNEGTFKSRQTAAEMGGVVEGEIKPLDGGNGGSGSSGCNAGFGVIALMALGAILPALRRK